MRMHQSLCRYVLFLLAVCFVSPAAPAAENSALATAVATIRTAELQEKIGYLADDRLEGREAGSKGGRAAGEYLAEKLRQCGLLPAGTDGTYFQPFRNGYRNVLGMIEGSDPALKNEVIVVGAHYDHVGYGKWENSHGPFGVIHNGADDNASGASGVMETVEAFASLARAPKRSILFAFWDGEELGLYGSKHWTDRPTVSLDRVALMFNLDMIGRLRDNRLIVLGTRSSRGLREIVSRQNLASKLDMEFPWELPENSDHFSFYERNVPVIMFYTGMHDDHHRPSDDVEKIDAEGLRRIVRLLFGVVHNLADCDDVPDFRPASRNEGKAQRLAFERPAPLPPSRFGVAWRTFHDAENSRKRGLILTRVAAGSAADRAGLRAGDRLAKFDGREIKNGLQFKRDVLTAAATVDVVVARQGEQEPLSVGVELAGRPVRLGISWRESDAEPGAVILSQVVPASAADRAGLKVGDRIYEVGHRRFRDSEQFLDLVTTLPSPTPLLVERAGRLEVVTLQLPPQAETVAAASDVSERGAISPRTE